MKIAIISLLLILSFSSAARFSAFAEGNKLYLTLLVDNCNSHNASIEIEPLCKKDRLTKNYATSCNANIALLSTKRACLAGQFIPKVFTIELDQLTPEAEELTLRLSADEQLTIDLN